MAIERLTSVTLDDGTTMAVVAEQIGGALVADDEIVGKLSTVMSSIEHVSRSVLDAVKHAAPTSATVELGFSLAIEGGHLVALFGKAKSEATLNVTLEWSSQHVGSV